MPEHIPLLTSPNLDPQVLEKLEAFPDTYRGATETRFLQGSQFIARYLADGIIHEGFRHLDYKLEAASLMERFERAADVYTAFQEYGLDPDVVVVPKLLPCWGTQTGECTLDEAGHWNSLFKKHGLKFERLSKETMLDPTKPQPEHLDLTTYDVAIMSRVLLRDVAVDGRNDHDTDRALKLLESLRSRLHLPVLSYPGFSAEEMLIRQFSPSEAAYLAKQLACLERREELFGVDGVVISKESTQDMFDNPKNKEPLFFAYEAKNHRFISTFGLRSPTYVNRGAVCPTVRVQDLMRQPQE